MYIYMCVCVCVFVCIYSRWGACDDPADEGADGYDEEQPRNDEAGGFYALSLASTKVLALLAQKYKY